MPEDKHSLRARYDRMREAVLAKKPVLKSVLERYGRMTLHEYASANRASSLADGGKVPDSRKESLLACFERQVASFFGPEHARGARAYLDRYYFVSTADHHGPVCHPFFLNSNLVTASAIPHEEPGYVITLAGGNIFFNNSSFPRGLLFQSTNGSETILHRLPFFSRQSRYCLVYGFPAYAAETIEDMLSSIAKEQQKGNVSPAVAKEASRLIRETYLDRETLGREDFCAQMTVANFHLWRSFFREGRRPSDLLYLESKAFTNRLLLEVHLKSDTLITRLLLDPDVFPDIQRLYDGIQGAFSSENGTGTAFFWALPPGCNGMRERMRREGNELVSQGGSYRVRLEREALSEAIRSGFIVPGMMLGYAILAFYHGLRCLGGFSQVNYLTAMRSAYLELCKLYGTAEDAAVAEGVTTDTLGGDLSVCFASLPNQDMPVAAMGLDLALYGKDGLWDAIVDRTKTLSLDDALGAMMPELYPLIYDEASRDPELAGFGLVEASRALGMDKKAAPVIDIR